MGSDNYTWEMRGRGEVEAESRARRELIEALQRETALKGEVERLQRFRVALTAAIKWFRFDCPHTAEDRCDCKAVEQRMHDRAMELVDAAFKGSDQMHRSASPALSELELELIQELSTVSYRPGIERALSLLRALRGKT